MDDKGKKVDYISGKGIKSYDRNPFVKPLMESVRTRGKMVAFAGKGQFVTDHGEPVGDMAVVGIRKTVEREQFVKVFQAGIKEAFSLRPAALGVLAVLLEAYRLGQVNSDKLYFNFQIALKDHEYDKSQKTYTSGMNELLKKEFVARVEGEPNRYYINPAFFFSGDRLRIIREFVVADPAKKVERDPDTYDMFPTAEDAEEGGNQ